MRDGESWFPNAPAFPVLPVGLECWHVYPREDLSGRPITPTQSNRKSAARFALPGTHGMYYLADTLVGVLWETLLRWIEPGADGSVEIDPESLLGQCAIKVRVQHNGIPHFPLTQPELRRRGLPPNHPKARELASLINDPEHRNTHAAARALADQLASFGQDLPVLSWMSRQHSATQVYLAYEPPMTSNWWQVIDAPIPLDDPLHGHALLRLALVSSGFKWPAPLYSPEQTPPGPPDLP